MLHYSDYTLKIKSCSLETSYSIIKPHYVHKIENFLKVYLPNDDRDADRRHADILKMDFSAEEVTAGVCIEN